ncbi:Hexose carrier protein HEX6 [Sesamum angolense]|uniref:Hexose carrier protein HEX6 n=1 Tax=Sesamum angolense TaxID=2727404 RepID=A0AAE1VTP0_9LAMI|nr:Hexose carrier protein HEX6 [Sesamum angolense]
MKEDSNVSNYCKFDSQLLTCFTSSLYIAGLVSSFFAATVTRKYGRIPSHRHRGLSYMVGAAIGGAALTFTNTRCAFSLSAVGSVVSRRNGSVEIQRSFNVAFQICIGIGQNSATLINYGTVRIRGGWGWRISLRWQACRLHFLHSGHFSSQRHQTALSSTLMTTKKAKKMLQKIRGTDDVQEELDDLIEASLCLKSHKTPFQEPDAKKNTGRSSSCP